MMDGQEHLDRIRAQFGKQADVYARMKQATDEKSLNALVQLTGAGADAEVLDVACGPGFLTMAFAARCRRATGIDATDALLAIARAEAAHRGLTNVEFRSGDAERLPYEAASFDVVSCRAAFHHFVRAEHVLAEMRRVAKPAGRLLIADMLSSEDAAKAEYHNRMERLCDPSHARALTRSEHERLADAAGLTVRFSSTVPLDMDVEEWIEHGGVNAATSAELRGLMEASIAGDASGLNVRRENGVLRFTYPIGVFVLAPK